jgi:DnaK suppressor protein
MAKKAAGKRKPAKPATKASKKPAAKASKKSASKKSASKKAASKSVKKTSSKSAKKAAVKSAAASKSAKPSTSKSSGKKKSMTAKSSSASKGGKKAAGASTKKPVVSRTATKVSNKGVLIRLKRSGPAPAPAAAAEERAKPRNVPTTEKSKGENPITLHRRKPTKKEAEEFRQLLITRRTQLQGDVNELEKEAFSDETQHVSSNHLADSSFEQYEQEFNLSMIENETEELKEIARALEKIDLGTFGECEACGIDISLERLHVMPYTRICIHCRSKFEEEGGGEIYGVHPERRV